MLDERKTKEQLITELSELRQRLIGSDQEQKKLKLSMAELTRAENIMQARLRLLKFAESHSLEEFTQATLDESEALTGSTIGFYHLVEADQRTLSLQTWSTNTLQHMCTAEGKGRHYDVAEAGVWVDCVHQRGSVIHNNYDALPSRKGMPPGHAPVVRELVVPIFRENKIVAIIGVGNKPSDYDEYDVEAVSLLGDLSWDITERKRAEERLRDQMQFTTTLLETIPIPVFYKDASGRYLGCNRAFEKFWGKCRETVIGKDVYEMGSKEVADKYAEMDQKLFERPGSQMYEWKVMAADGLEKEVIFYKASFPDATGKVAGLIGVILDITDRKRAEEALAEQHELMDYVIRHDPNAIAVLNNELRYVFVSERYLNDYGVKETDIIGKHHYEVFPEMPQRWKEVHRRVLAGAVERSDDDYLKRPDGSITYNRWECRPWYRADGSIGGMIMYTEVTTERKQAEKAFQVLVDHAPMGIFIIQDGKYILTNPGLETITGYSREEFLGQESECLATPAYKAVVRGEAVKRLKGETSTPFEFQFMTKSGEIRWGMESIAPTHFEGKRAILGYFMDITEHKQLEEHFLQGQKMEAVGTLAGGIAHDFNNILTSILGNIGLAALDDEIGPRVRDNLAQAEGACLRAQSLSHQLLTFAKGGAPVKKRFSVAELLTKSTAFTCVGSQVKCETTFPENLWWIEADPGQIDQVFQNLTINAIQAMPTGGTIKVWAENLTIETGSELPLSPGRYIKISVRDRGMGIPADHLPRIFDPYFTTKQRGSGLGLASAYTIINRHHGHIAVESKPGVGTTFDTYLPAIDRQVAPQPAA